MGGDYRVVIKTHKLEEGRFKIESIIYFENKEVSKVNHAISTILKT